MNLYRVGKSPVSGMGLFATQFIPEGTRWWHVELKDMLRITRRQYELLLHFSTGNEAMLASITRYSYYIQHHDALFYICDEGRFLNHSSNPNSALSPDRLSSVTTRDVQEGEELFEDYLGYDRCPWADLWESLGQELGLHRIPNPDCSTSTPGNKP